MNSRRYGCLVFVAFNAVACGSTADDDGSFASQDLIDGVPADGPAFNAIGALSGARASTYCTATLIAPTAVLTAKHCILEDELSFNVGPNSFEPARTIRIEAYEAAADLEDPGASGYGSDVAIFKLAEPITDIEPLRIADALSADQIGTKLSFVGYGVKGRRDHGYRRQGTLTLRATSGRPCEIAFPSFDDFATFAENGMDLSRDEARELCDQPLVQDYEVWAGGASGDAQTCNGDSGGPLIIEKDGTKQIVGVASWVYRSVFGGCPRGGGAFAVFGPGVRQFIEARL